MSAPVMDPEYEQKLRDEVIYLHSLWHQGPPRPTTSASAATPHHLQPSNTTQFKKESRGKKGKKFRKKANKQTPDSKSSPGAEWPCPTPPPPQDTSGWPSLVAQPVQSPLLPSLEENLKLAAKQAQLKALKTVREFLRSHNADIESDSIDSSSNEDHDFVDDDDGRHDYTFFLKVFMEDVELKEYYEKNFVKGEFCCLICAAVGGKNTRKRFKGCLALVQHSITIAKTKKRHAHSAYGQAVCKVLGWDIDRLPAIVSMLSDNSGEAQFLQRNLDSVNLVNNVESADGNGEVVPENSPIGSGSVPNAGEGIGNSLTAIYANNNSEGLGMVNSVSVEETVAEGFASNSLVVADADYTLEGPDMVGPSNVEESVAAGLTSNSLMAADADNTVGNPLNVETVAEGLLSNSLTITGGNNTLEDVGMVHSCNVDELVTQELASGPLNENSSVEMGIAVLDGLKEDAKTED